jgi:hypothetical protein
MVELVRTNDPVFLSWLVATLAGDGIRAVVLDGHTSVMEGSISAIQRRVMVDDGDLWRAKRILAEGEAIRAGREGPVDG